MYSMKTQNTANPGLMLNPGQSLNSVKHRTRSARMMLMVGLKVKRHFLDQWCMGWSESVISFANGNFSEMKHFTFTKLQCEAQKRVKED